MERRQIVFEIMEKKTFSFLDFGAASAMNAVPSSRGSAVTEAASMHIMHSPNTKTTAGIEKLWTAFVSIIETTSKLQKKELFSQVNQFILSERCFCSAEFLNDLEKKIHFTIVRKGGGCWGGWLCEVVSRILPNNYFQYSRLKVRIDIKK